MRGYLCRRFGYNETVRAVGSVVEHFVHTEGVTGSNPVPPTTFLGSKRLPSGGRFAFKIVLSLKSSLISRVSRARSLPYIRDMATTRADNTDGSCRQVLTGRHKGKWRVQYGAKDARGVKKRLSRLFDRQAEAKDLSLIHI